MWPSRDFWQARLPGGANATPSTYIISRNNRQFVIIAAGGNKALKTTMANKNVAFALPRSSSSTAAFLAGGGGYAQDA